MSEYHKIQSVFKRDTTQKRAPFIEGAWTRPEFEYLADNCWTFTEKVDGTNIRVFPWNKTNRFGGRTDNAQIPVPLLNALERTFEHVTPELCEQVFTTPNVVLYGEGFGAKIQKAGGNYRPDPGFVLFDVNVDGWWLHRDGVEDIARRLGIDVVPVIGEGTLHDALRRCQEGFFSQWGDFLAEGIVARPKVELRARDGSRIITKVKFRDF